MTKVKIGSLHTIGLVRLILAIFLHDNTRNYPNVLFFFNKQGSPDHGRVPPIAKSRPSPSPAHGACHPYPQRYSCSCQCSTLPVPVQFLDQGLHFHRLPSTPKFVALSDEGHALLLPAGQHPHCVSPSFCQTPRYSIASFRDPTCIHSALPLLTPWILQSPNQTPASHFPSWVSDLREWRDSGTCLSIKRTPGCCLPFVVWW